MKYEIIQTGSKGNAILIEECFLLDCGVSYAKLKKHLKNIKFIFIGHSHNDHFKTTTIKQIAFEKPNIKFVVGNYLVTKLLDCGVQKKNIIVLDIEKWYQVGNLKIRLDYLYHDVPNDCIHIQFPDGKKVFYATDTNKIDHVFAEGYDYYFIEANYLTDAELNKKIKEDKENGRFSYYERVKDTHLSQLQAINWLDKNMGANSKYIFIHQHIEKEN